MLDEGFQVRLTDFEKREILTHNLTVKEVCK